MFIESVAILCLLILGFTLQKVRRSNKSCSNNLTLLGTRTFIWFLRASSSTPLYEIYNKLYFKHGRLSCLTFLGTKQMYIVGKPELVKAILVENFSKMMDRMSFSKTGDPVFDRSLIFLNHKDWRLGRKAITPVFAMSKIREVIPEISLAIRNLMDTLEEFAGSGETCDVRQVFDGLALDVIALVAFGIRINSFKEKNNAFVKNVKGLFETLSSSRILGALYVPMLVRLFKIKIVSEKCASFLRKVLNKEIGQRMEASEVNWNRDLLSLLMKAFPPKENPKNNVIDKPSAYLFKQVAGDDWQMLFGMTNDGDVCSLEILSHCVVFLMAGYETTATALTCAAHCLAFNENHQDKAATEVQEVVGMQEEVSVDVLDELPFNSAVISETLRLYPSVPTLNRAPTEDVVIGEDLHLKKRATITIPISAMHRDPEFFPEPNTFNPYRFLGDERNSIMPYTYLPFGSGPRNCAGFQFALLETKLVLSTVLHRYRFVTVPETRKELRMRLNSPLIYPEELLLRIEKRS